MDTSSIPELAYCLPSLMEALGWRGNAVTLAELFPGEPEELTLAGVLARLERQGYRAREYFMRHKDGLPPGFPGLLVTSRGNVLTLLRPDDGGVLCFSGTLQAYQHYGQAQIDELFQGGVYFSFSESQGDPESKAGPFWFQDLASRHRGILGTALLFSFILSLFGILTPQFIRLLYEEIGKITNPASLVALGMGALLFLTGELFFSGIRLVLLNHLKFSFLETLGRQVLRRIIYFPLALSHNLSPGAQSARIREFEEMAQILGQSSAQALLDLPFIVVLLVALGLMGGQLVLIPLVSFVIFLLMALFAYPLLKKTEQEASPAMGTFQSALNNALEKVEDLQRLGLEGYMAARLEMLDRKALPGQLGKLRLQSHLNFISHGLVSLSGLITVAAGAFLVLDGRMSPGALLASMMMVWRILDPARSLFTLLGTLQTVVQSGSRLQRFMALQGERPRGIHSPPLNLEAADVAVENFYYRYPGTTRFALANINFSVSQGKSLGISGPAGSGLSTLSQALMGLLDGTNGRISVGGQVLQQYDLIALRSNIGHLPVKVPIIPVSIRENLQLAKANSTDLELVGALERAGALSYVEGLTLGLDTLLEDRFLPDQSDFFRCLGIARLYLRKQKLWVLDEPEWGLSPGNRKLFLRNLRAMKGRTTMIIFSNDPDFTALCDQRATLSEGRLTLEAST